MAGFLVRFGARLLFLLMAARLFGVSLFGAFSVAVAVVEFAVAVAGLGNKRLIFKWLDSKPSDRPAGHVLLDAALLVAAVGLLLAATIMVAVAILPASMIAPATATALFLVAPMVAGQALLDLLLAATRWHHSMRYEVVGRSMVEPYAATTATLAAWLVGWVGTGLVLGYWAGTLATLFYAVAGTRRVFGSFALRSYRVAPSHLLPLLRQSGLPTLSDALNAFFTRLDLYLVGALLGEAPAGIYNMARQIRIPIRQVRQSFDGLLTPLIARTLASGGEIETGKAAASATRLILAIQLALLVSLVALGHPLLDWFGRAFAPGYWAMIVLAAAESIQGAFGVSDLLFLYRRPLVTVNISIASIAINALAGLLLIAPLGVLGAALAVLVANLAAAAIRRVALHTSFGIRTALDYNAGPLVAGAAGSASALLIVIATEPGFGLAGYISACAAGLAIYAACLFGWMAASGDRLSLAHLRTR